MIKHGFFVIRDDNDRWLSGQKQKMEGELCIDNLSNSFFYACLQANEKV